MAAADISRTPAFCECGDHAFVNLTKWGVALVSPEDAWVLSERLWHIVCSMSGRQAYARSTDRRRMHREILGCSPDELGDHKNHNGLDNRRPNLRMATPSTNQFNKRAQLRTSSRYKGVRFCKKLADGSPYWKSAIYMDGKERILGHFKDEVAAAHAYDAAAQVMFGEFAATNASLGLL